MGKSERVSFQRKCLLVSLCSGTPTSPSATPPPGGAIPAVQATAEAGGENGQVVISYAAWDYERQIYEPLAKKFMDENPGPDYSAFGALSQAIEATLGPDKKDPQKALQEAQKQLLQQLADAAQNTTPTPTPNTGPVVVATTEPQAAPEGATPVKFAAYGYSPSDLRRLARSFRDQYPEIFVTIQSTDTFTETPTFAQLAKTSDCFSWWSPPQTDDDFKALLDLQPLFDADASFPQSDYAPALLAPYQRSGGLFGLPYAATLRTLTYNKTAFDAAGIKPPTYQWKPDDFLAAAQALTRGEGDKKQFGYVPLGGAQQDMLFFVGQFGGQLIGGSGKDVRPNFTDPKVVQALQWYLDLSTVHKVMPPLKFQYQRDDQGFEDKSYELVQGGRAGMWFDQGYGMFGGPTGEGLKGGGPGGPQPPNFEVAIAPLPWMKFMSGDVSNLQGGIPARTSVIKSDAFAKQASPDMVALAGVYVDALKQHAESSGQGGDPKQIYSLDTYWFFKALSEALEKKTPLGQGLAEAQQPQSAQRTQRCGMQSGDLCVLFRSNVIYTPVQITLVHDDASFAPRATLPRSHLAPNRSTGHQGPDLHHWAR